MVYRIHSALESHLCWLPSHQHIYIHYYNNHTAAYCTSMQHSIISNGFLTWSSVPCVLRSILCYVDLIVMRASSYIYIMGRWYWCIFIVSLILYENFKKLFKVAFQSFNGMIFWGFSKFCSSFDSCWRTKKTHFKHHQTKRKRRRNCIVANLFCVAKLPHHTIEYVLNRRDEISTFLSLFR